MRVLAIAVVLAAAEPRARADELDDARKLEASLEYEKALVLVDNAIAHGGLDAARLSALHFEAGKLAAGLDHPDAAEEHFARALSLDPTRQLAPDTSPKITTPFEAARARARPLHVDHQRRGLDVTVTADPDPLHLVSSIELHVVDASGRAEQLVTRDGPPFALRLPAGASELEITAKDEHGNVVYVGRDRVEAPPPSIVHHHAWYASWKLWATTAAFAGAVGGLSAWRERVAQDDWNQLRDDPNAHDYSQLRAVEDRGRAWALATDISFGVAGAATIGAVIAAVAGRDRTEPAIAITAGPGMVGVAGRF